MIEKIDSIIEKQATIKRIPSKMPTVEKNLSLTISYDDFQVPQRLVPTLLARSGIEKGGAQLSEKQIAKQIAQRAKENDLFIRYAGERPIGLVTSEFQEIKPRELALELTRILGYEPTVRYSPSEERLQLNFPLTTHMPGLNVLVNTGEYGTYGGSGRQALKYGISWYNTVCTNWTVFLQHNIPTTFNKRGRIVHLSKSSPEYIVNSIKEGAGFIEEKIETSRDNPFSRGDLEAYASVYSGEIGKKILGQIVTENPTGMSAYQFSYRLTQLCQNPKLSDVTRARIEHLAGEVIISYKDIMTYIASERQSPAPHAGLEVLT